MKWRWYEVERTISGMMGKGSINHNNRSFHAENVDPERSKYNIEYCNSDLKAVYHELFDKAVGRYNAKQDRNDRMISDYYEKIRVGKQEKLFHEVVFQIGNKDDMDARSENGQIAKEVLDEFMSGFQERNPNLHVFSAHLHMDEATPHLHIDFVPYTTGSKRGVDTRVSLKQALASQGFKGGKKRETEWNQWMESEKQELSEIMERHQIRWNRLDTHNKHLSVLDFQKQERQKEVIMLERKIEEADIEYKVMSGKAEQKKVELTALNIKTKKADEKLEKLETLQEKIRCDVRIYDENEEWQLPEPVALSTAKSYREKKALPLVRKLKKILKQITIKYLRAAAKIEELVKEIKHLREKVDYQGKSLKKVRQENLLLKESVRDFEMVKQVVGEEKVNDIISATKNAIRPVNKKDLIR